MKTTILRFGEPSFNDNKIYDKDSVIDIPDCGFINLADDNFEDMNPNNIIGLYYDAKIEENELTCIVKINAHHEDKYSNAKFSPYGTGRLEGKTITHYTMRGLNPFTEDKKKETK